MEILAHAKSRPKISRGADKALKALLEMLGSVLPCMSQ